MRVKCIQRCSFAAFWRSRPVMLMQEILSLVAARARPARARAGACGPGRRRRSSLRELDRDVLDAGVLLHRIDRHVLAVARLLEPAVPSRRSAGTGAR